MNSLKLVASFLSVALVCCSVAKADFFLDINYTGDPQFQSAFDNAEATWESILSGYQDGIVAQRTSGSSYQIGDTVDTIFINASVDTIDGVGGILGSAGFSQRVIDNSGFSLSTDGNMTFDSADMGNLSTDILNTVILHEMGHVMGFGTQWVNNGLYNNNSGEFLGANATAFWASEFGQTGTPDVELAGGAGTANAHWNENTNGAGLVGITDAMGRDMRDELMTGWANPNAFISEMTVGQFVDIGFTRTTAVPEPTSLVVLMFAGTCLATRRQRR